MQGWRRASIINLQGRQVLDRMHPVTINGCFGWVHESGLCRRAALVLPPLGYELLGAHQAIRQLAEMLAQANIVTLRIDYPGFGDSLDPEPSGSRVMLWNQRISDAIDWLKAQTGLAEIVLIGVRFGAALAVQSVLDRSDVSHLVMIEPVLDGAAFVRETRALARFIAARDLPPGTAAPVSGDIEIEGFILEAALIDELRGIKPLQGPLASALSVISLSSAPQTAIATWCNSAAAMGSKYLEIPFAQASALQLASVPPAPPLDDLRNIVAALDGGLERPYAFQVDGAVLQTADFIERAVRFGKNGSLAGVLCTPAGNATVAVTIILNTGAIHHIGNGRIWVDEARELAKCGIATFRMDIEGIGDSVCKPAGPYASLYAEQRAADASAAIDLLSGLGFRSFTVCGICSGAYLAMHAAFADQRIGHVVAVNPQVILFPEGRRDLPSFLTRSVSSSKIYMNRLKDLGRWKRLLQGEIDVPAVMSSLARSLQRLILRIRSVTLGMIDRIVPQSGHGRRIWSSLRTVSERGGRLSILFSANDVGFEEFNAQLGSYLWRVRRMPAVHIEVVAEGDHIFVSRSAKLILRRFLAERLA